MESHEVDFSGLWFWKRLCWKFAGFDFREELASGCTGLRLSSGSSIWGPDYSGEVKKEEPWKGGELASEYRGGVCPGERADCCLLSSAGGRGELLGVTVPVTASSTTHLLRNLNLLPVFAPHG